MTAVWAGLAVVAVLVAVWQVLAWAGALVVG